MKSGRKVLAIVLVSLLQWNVLAAAQSGVAVAPSQASTALAQSSTSVKMADASTPPVAAPAPAAAIIPTRLTLKEGTPVKLVLAKNLSSKTCATGDPVDFTVAEDLKVGDRVVVRKGAQALGTIAHAKKAGSFGKGGELTLRLEYLKAGDARVRLRGAQGHEGEGKQGAVVALTVAFGVVGFLKHGKQAEVKAGAPVDAVVDQDTELAAQE